MNRRLTDFLLLLLFTSIPYLGFAQIHQTVQGFVREKGNGQALTGVTVYVPSTRSGVQTSSTGFFSLVVPKHDSVTLTFSYVGYTTVTKTFSARALPTNQLTVYLTPGKTLSEVIVKSKEAYEQVSDSPNMSQISISLDQLKKIPALLGEKDVLKVIQLLPGVQKGSEGSTGIYVRGGGPDQNLLILDEAVVYNPNHLFGFFSVFNGDALRSVDLTKGGFPAYYGGRLSSVIDMKVKEGSKQQFQGTGSVGLIASRLTVEGPLLKGKISYLISGRRSYYGALTRLLTQGHNSDEVPSKTWFHDFNAKIDAVLSQKDRLYISGYTGYDRFRGQRSNSQNIPLTSDLDWGNTTATLRWTHTFSPKVVANTSLVYSQYKLQVANEETVTASDSTHQLYQLKYISGIRDVSIKNDWEVYGGTQHQFRFGLQSTYHRFTPSAVVETNVELNPVATDPTDVIESGLYAEHFWTPNQHWRLHGGLRLSHLIHKDIHYLRPEPRGSVAYVLPHFWSVKASYALMNQYVHMLSNTGTGLPTDLWVPTTDRVKPQESKQLAIGLVKEFGHARDPNRRLTLTVEGYHKTMANIISYREGASFLIPTDSKADMKARWEDNVTAGEGWSSGVEVLLQKKAGRFSGWMGYTLSYTRWRFPELNGGRSFYPRYDRRHDASLVGIYELSSRIRLSGSWVYGTGQALTLPIARYSLSSNNPERALYPGLANAGRPLFGNNQTVKDYSGKNSFRAEPYHRLDLGLQISSRNNQNTWELNVYNAYNRRNPFFYSMEGKVDIKNKPSRSVLYRYSLFPIVPTINYSFKF